MKAGIIDLHCHSTISDGSVEPQDLVVEAKMAGLEFLALTDHDSVEGLPAFKEAAQKANFTAISGVEISLEYPGTMHLLGLDVHDGGIVPEALDSLQDFRRSRNRQIFKKLKDLNLDVSWERLVEISGNGQLGRPHFARHLLERGVCHNFQEAYEKYLGKGKAAYVDKKRPEIREGLELVRAAGWAPVLAHPHSLEINDNEYKPILRQMKDWGLVGLEVYHPTHSAARSSFFHRLAQELALVETAGSDYHGSNKPGLTLSWVPGNSPLGGEILEELKIAITK